ncbi:hypothetical protein IQ07DRAFT_517254 [Pyrenochaeta sp. DS3sAY3a]|nr:hypothetical protein IQ07DRAFT_517254 [Pyrenochaeta sp. DS3sAY3a]
MDPGIDPSDIPDIHSNTDGATDGPTETISIVDDGDVTLVVGKERMMFRVSSAILAICSSVFAAIFRDMVLSTQPKEITLPDDDAPSMEIMLRAIHYNKDVPECLLSGEALSVALVANKYNCIGPLKYISSVWTDKEDMTGICILGRLMSAAYIFRNHKAFTDLTLALMTTAKGGYQILADSLENLPGMDAVPLWKIIYQLEARRARMRTQLQQILLHTSLDATGCSLRCCKCSKPPEFVSYVLLLSEQHLTPVGIQNMSIEEALRKFDSMEAPAVKPRPCKEWVSITSPTMKERKEQRLKDFTQKWEGLCLDCVRGETQGNMEVCLQQHEPPFDVGAYYDSFVPASS